MGVGAMLGFVRFLALFSPRISSNMSISVPLVSIITATYNRSNVLRYTIESVLRSTFEDWELLVIGDACTDDTEEMVASFDEPRIHFTNLNENVGEQSGPNNEGFRRSRGRFIAYLNHDDLWLANHLETAMEGIEETGAGLVFTLLVWVLPDGSRRLGAASPTGRYEPYMMVPASCWLMRRELIESVGPWRSHRELYDVPSQDWLLRASADNELRMVPKVTVVAIPSGERHGSYSGRDVLTNQRYFERIASEPDFLEPELTEIAVHYAAEATSLRVWPCLQKAGKNAVRQLVVKSGSSTRAFVNFLRYRRKGGFIDRLRQNRGLPELKRNR